MNSTVSKPACMTWIAVAIFFCATRGLFAEFHGSIKLNEDAFAVAAQRISDGHAIADLPCEYETQIQVPVWRFQERSPLRFACRESQSSAIRLHRNRKRGRRIAAQNKIRHGLIRISPIR